MEGRWIDAGKVPYQRSQSIYHGLAFAQKKETQSTIVLATPESAYMCIGHFQDLEKEIDLEYCRGNNLPIVRRETGGGGVYIDSGQLFVQWIFQREDLPRKVEQRFMVFLEPIVETYKFFGVQAKIYPPNDVHVDGKKIVGTGAATIGDAEVVTGNFIFDFNIESMTMAMQLPNNLFREQLRTGLKDYITTFKKELGVSPTREEVSHVYMEKCKKHLGFNFENGAFTPTEIDSMNHFEKRCEEDHWLFSISTRPSKERLLKIHAGVWLGLMIHRVENSEIEVMIRMKERRIEFIRIRTLNGGGWDDNWSELEKELFHKTITESELNTTIQSYFERDNRRDKFSITDWVEAVLKIQKEKQKVLGYA